MVRDNFSITIVPNTSKKDYTEIPLTFDQNHRVIFHSYILQAYLLKYLLNSRAYPQFPVLQIKERMGDLVISEFAHKLTGGAPGGLRATSEIRAHE